MDSYTGLLIERHSLSYSTELEDDKGIISMDLTKKKSTRNSSRNFTTNS